MSLPPELARARDEIREVARGLGLDFFEVVYEVVTWEEMNQVAAYGGFPVRYPHWRFGMEYERLSKSHAYGLSKIYELVINNNPSIAYLQESNELVDQKLVMAHVYGHSDFFKNNVFFAHTNRRMVDGMSNNAATVRRHMDRQGQDRVEAFLDLALSLEHLIDPHRVFLEARSAPEPKADEEHVEATVQRIRAKEYLDPFVNPPEFLEEQRRKLAEEKERRRRFPERPERDILLFLIQHAALERWQRDLLEIVREESYYFLPQRQTKVANEGWACVAADSLVFTSAGLMEMRELVGGMANTVSDGLCERRVTDSHVLRDRPMVTIRTRRGLTLSGSDTHRVRRADAETWVRLDQLQVGDRVEVSGGNDLWPQRALPVYWSPRRPVSLETTARRAGVSLSTLIRMRAANRLPTDRAGRAALLEYESQDGGYAMSLPTRRSAIRVPQRVDEELGAFLGYLAGDGHVSRVKRHVGLTTADLPQAERFSRLAHGLFGLESKLRRDGNRWRVLLHSLELMDFLTEYVGLPIGPSARRKTVPDLVLASPEPVVRAFLRAYFDCDGYGGEQGVILSTASEKMSQQVQLLLLNYGILSRRRRQRDGCFQVQVRGRSAERFAERIGFGLERKQQALQAYVRGHRWYREERWEDEVTSIEAGRGDVYDITVADTHRYAAQGLVNHNSFWHSRIMTERVLQDSEVVDYADHCSGVFAMPPGQFNPYKVGLELWRDIERRWDRGQFGKEWEECEDWERRLHWDTKAMKGREKIFEVRRLYNDLTFIDTFLTPDFCDRAQLFVYKYNERTRRLEISDREFQHIKDQLLFQLTNAGDPVIHVEDGNFENRGELLLLHDHQGVELDLQYARDTLQNLARIWGRPCHVRTRIGDKERILSHDGNEFRERTL